MKVIKHLLIIFLLYFSSSLQGISFIYPKIDSNMSLNGKFLRLLSSQFNVDVFLESGTYLGKTCDAALPFFDQIYTIELNENLYEKAVQHFADTPKVHIYHGSSDQVFLELLPTLRNHKILFWLDGHYSKTAELANVPYKRSTPIMEELESIRLCHITNAVILVDDLRLFGTDPEYPTLQELKNAISAISPDYQLIIYGDIALAFNCQEQITISDALLGMTAYFFPHQSKSHWGTLIQHANTSEKTAIKQLAGSFPVIPYNIWRQKIS